MEQFPERTSDQDLEVAGDSLEGEELAEVATHLEYALPGDPPFFQVEPEASYWSRCRFLCTVTREDVRRRIGVVPRYPSPGSRRERQELEQIRLWQKFAHDEGFFREVYGGDDLPRLSVFLKDERFIRRPPEGAVLNRRGAIRVDPERPGLPIIRYGAELASLFEAETPGLWHQHVFNVLLNSPAMEGQEGPLLRELLSPPRQSLIWHALYTAIDSALDTIWHYKWLASGLPQVARRRRPYEADPNPILYDYELLYDDGGNIRRDRELRTRPHPSPGSPRHPAYGSGHSTYSAAASYVLGCLLPRRHAEEFAKLADNIGEARIWGGVHWETDHTFGRKVGLLVGRLVVEQLNRSGISPMPGELVDPPSRRDLEAAADEFERLCGKHANDFCAAEFRMNLQGQAG
jgi:hypothetical protein